MSQPSTYDDSISERAVGTTIVEKALQQTRGHHREFCIEEEPKRAYYISNLTPSEDGVDSGLVSEIRPQSLGLDFKPITDEIPVQLSFEVYYHTRPTYEEYKQLASSDQWGHREVFNSNFYRRVDVELSDTLSLATIQSDAKQVTRQLQEKLRKELNDQMEKTPRTSGALDIDEDTEVEELSRDEFADICRRYQTTQDGKLVWPLEFTATRTDSGLRLRLRLRSFDSRTEVPGIGANQSDVAWDPSENAKEAEEECVFNPKISVQASVEPFELDLHPEEYRFEEQIWAKGHNCSTTAERLSESSTGEQEEGEFNLSTTAVPTAPVYEFKYRTDQDTTLDTRFLSLAGAEDKQPIDLLVDIADGMDEYYDEWITSRKQAFAKTHTPEEVKEFEAGAERFREIEIERFRAGIRMLRDDEEALRAFQLMNRVNHYVHWTLESDGFKRWRLFQLVFIVSNLPDIVARDPDPSRSEYGTKFDDAADVLWFPTGGGKTEAYLGIILFTLFFDRIRGKDRGVTAWIRFPLRLLSSQQKSRFLKSILAAEKYRSQDPAADDNEFGLGDVGDEFSLGFYVGSQDTPNSIGPNKRSLYQNNHDVVEQECQVVSQCPLCGADVEIQFDETRNLVEHFCTNPDCVGRLPLYVTDHDVYRYLPSVLLGSLDKISVMGFQPRFTNIMGNLTTECPVHGLGYSGACPEKEICDIDTREDVSPGTREDRSAMFFDPIPSLHLVDEVHLLNEELGTLAGHYETAYLELCKMSSKWQDDVDKGVEPKVLTSTATIAKYDRQMNHLFKKEAVRFPQEGPALRETYYGELEETKVERLYGGVTPNNRTHLYAILDFIKQYHEIIRDYHDIEPDQFVREVVQSHHRLHPNKAPDKDPTDPSDLTDLVRQTEWVKNIDKERKAEILDLYETSLVYFTNKREKDIYRSNIGKQIADEMEAEGYEQPLKKKQLTADTGGTGVLDTLLDPPESYAKRTDTIPCTSFVGHGIDNPRFNFMIFFGYPSQTFQYIQASSRVGRQSDVPGFVLDFFRPFDLRDRHRYKYFETLHQHLSRTVEPVAIDRWAKFAAEQTHPGIVKSILIQYYRPRGYWHTSDGGYTTFPGRGGEEERVNVQKADHFYQIMHDDRFPKVSRKQLKTLVRRLYRVSEAKQPVGHIKQTLDEETDQIWRTWNNELGETMNMPRFPDGEGPMRNLRDIGENGQIHPLSSTEPLINALIGGDQ